MGEYLEDPGLLFEIFIFIGLGIGKMVDFDAVLVDLVENLDKTKV